MASSGATPGLIVAASPLITPLPGLVTAVKIPGIARSFGATGHPRRLLALRSLGLRFLDLRFLGLRSLLLGRLTFLGFPAILRACLPTLVVLAMDIAFTVCIDIVWAVTRRAGIAFNAGL